MSIVCPHCHNTLDLPDSKATEAVCPACGSGLHLETGATTAWSPADGRRRVGKFDLIDAVGIGGFGTVFKARDTELDRIVAIKVPRSGNLTSQADLDRFLREARSVAQLRHPSIVSVYEAGQADGVPYLVSEFVQGLTLADLLSSRRPSPQASARLLATVARALHYAHEQGVVHRDVKPANILLSGSPDTPVEEYTPHLMDFGLAKRDAGEVTITIDGQVLGTPAYMSPEQARGEGHAVDGRGDVYSIGVILYEMLTGELPFRGTTRMLLHQVLHEEPKPPRSLNERIPRDLQTICLKAMAKEPGRRYQTALELAEDLERFLKGEPIRARPVGRGEQLWRWCRRNPAVAGLTATIAALLVLVAVGATVAAYRISTLAADKLELAESIGLQARRLNEANELIDSARVRADRGDVAKALDELTRAVELRPDSPVGWAERGSLYVRLGFWEEAARDMAEQFQRLSPADPTQWFQHACLRLRVNDRAGYRKVCAEMLERFGQPDDPVGSHYTAAVCGLTPDAVADWAVPVGLQARAQAAQPQSPVHLASLGLVLLRAGRLKDAEARYREAQQVMNGVFRPHLPIRVWAGAALTHQRLGQVEQARECLDQADKRIDQLVGPRGRGMGMSPYLSAMSGSLRTLTWVLGPTGSWPAEFLDGQLLYEEAALAIQKPATADDRRFWLPRCTAYAKLGRADRALAMLTEAVARAPRDADLRLERARLAAQQQQWDTAEADYSEAIAILPAAPAARLDRARLRAGRGQTDPAAADFAAVLELLPDNSKERAAAYGELVRVDAVLDRVASLRPADVALRSECARLYVGKRQFERAFEYFRQALALKDDEAQVWVERGNAHAELAHWDQAASDFKKAFALQPPGDPIPWQAFACLQLQRGDVEGYRQMCARMLEVYGPSDDEAAVRLLSSTLILGPRALQEPKQVIQRAERRLARLPVTIWTYHALGMAYFRAGQFEEAIQSLRKATEVEPKNRLQCLNWLGLALAHAALGQTADSRQWFEKAEQAIQSMEQARPADWKVYQPPGWTSWWDWWKVQRLRAEVRQALAEPSTPSSKTRAP